MIRFAAMLADLPRDPSALGDYLAAASGEDAAACRALLGGSRPRRLVTLDTVLAWAAEVAGIPDWLAEASLQASGDRAETAALMLPAPEGPAPSLSEVVSRLTAATPVTRHAILVRLWACLPSEANLIVSRLATGTFRLVLAPPVAGRGGTFLAVMVQAQVSPPEITVALDKAGSLVPVARVALTVPETAEIMAWVGAHTLARFGPLRQVEPGLVFEVAFDGVTRNGRKKSGLDLQNARIVAWPRDGQAGKLAELSAHLAPAPASPLQQTGN